MRRFFSFLKKKPEAIVDILLIIGLFGMAGILLFSLMGRFPYRLTLVHQPRAPFEMRNESLPDISLKDLEGKEHSLSSYRGKPILLVFWSSQCKFCQEEMPKLKKFSGKHPEVILLGVGLNDTKEGLLSYSAKQGIPFPTLWDEEGEARKLLKPDGTPNYFFIDAEGRLRLVHRGTGILDSTEFQKLLQEVKASR